MPAHAGAGLQDVDARVAVGQADQFPHIDVELVADDGQLVGKSDVDVAEAVFGELAHFCRAGVGDDAFALHEGFVQAYGRFGAARGQAADHAIVLHQLLQHLPGQHALGAVGDADVGFFASRLRKTQVRPGFSQPGGHLLGGAHGGGGFQNDEVAALQHRGDGLAGGLDVAEVGLVVVLEGGGHGDEEGIGGLGGGGGAQVAFGDGGVDDHVEVGLDDVDGTTVDGVDGVLVEVDANDLDFARGKDGGGGQTDVAEADDGDGFEGHGGRERMNGALGQAGATVGAAAAVPAWWRTRVSTMRRQAWPSP